MKQRDSRKKGLIAAIVVGLFIFSSIIIIIDSQTQDAPQKAQTLAGYSKTIYGYVYDSDSNPLPDCDIIVTEMTTYYDEIDTTDEYGYYSVVFAGPEWDIGDTFRVTVTYLTWETFEDDIATSDASQEIDVYFSEPFSIELSDAWEDHLYNYQVETVGTPTGFSLDTDSDWLFVNSTGMLSGTPDNTDSEYLWYANVDASIEGGGHEYFYYQVFVDNKQPSFTSTSSTAIGHRHAYSYDANADDPGTFSISTNYSGSKSFNTGNGQLSFNANIVGQFWFNIVFNDGTGAGNATNNQNWTVTIWPIITFSHWPDWYVEIQEYMAWAWEDHAFTWQITTNRTITSWLFDGNATFLTISSSGLVSGTPNNNFSERQLWSIHVKATCVDGYEWQNFTVWVVNYQPQFTSTPPTGFGFTANYWYNCSFDDFGLGNLFFGHFENLETDYGGDYTWNINTGKLNFTATAPGSWWFNITVHDATGSDNETNYQNWTVTLNAVDPVFTSTPLGELWVLDTYSYQATCNYVITSWSYETNAEWIAVDGNGHVTGSPPPEAANKIYYVHLHASNFLGDAWQNYTLTVSEHPIRHGYFDLPDNVRPYIWLMLAIFGLVIGFQTINFIGHTMKHGMKGEDMKGMFVTIIMLIIVVGIIIILMGVN